MAAGTPFTFEGAKELMRLGICAICIPVGSRIAAEIVYHIMAHFIHDVSSMQISDSISISAGLGIMMIVGSLLCRYGAEREQEIVTDTKRSEE